MIQECLQDLVAANEERTTGFEANDQYPDYKFCHRFVQRNGLVLRRTIELSKGRERLTEDEIQSWQKETYDLLVKENPEIWNDPHRIFNQDETSYELSEGSVRVLAKKGSKRVPGTSSGSRNHGTLSVTANANGDLVWPRVVIKGVRDVSKKYLSELQPGVRTGAFRFSYSDSGFVNKDLFVKIILDLDEYVTLNNIQKPIVLFLDGASCHISMEVTLLSKERQIRLWLIYPNSTHILQPLDLGRLVR